MASGTMERGGNNNSVLAEQIKTLGESMQRGFTEIKDTLANIETRVRSIENAEAGSHPLINSQIAAAWRKLEEHDVGIKFTQQSIASTSQKLNHECDRIAEVEKKIDLLEKSSIDIGKTLVEFKQVNKLLGWVTGLVAAGVISWIVAGVLGVIGT